MMKKIIRSEFFRNVLALMGGTFMAQAISMGSSPIITRLFTPENFGLLALFSTSVGIISRVGALCYERAIVLPSNNRDAINIFFLSVATLLFTTLITFTLVVFFNSDIADSLGNPEFSFWLWFVPGGILLAGMVKIMSSWRSRYKEFKQIGYARISEAAVSALIKISIGFLIGAYSGGLIGGMILGSLVSFHWLFCNPTVFHINKNLREVSKATIKNMAVTYKQFPQFAAVNALLLDLSKSLVVFMFSAFFSPVVVGFYSLGNRVLNQPINLVSTSVQKVYFQKCAQDINSGIHLISGLKKTTFVLFLAGFLPFGAIAIFGGELFGMIFGQNWETAGSYIQVLSPWFFFSFAASPAHVIFEVSQKQGIKLFISVSRTVAVTLSIVVGCLLSSDPVIVLFIFAWVNIFFEVITVGMAFFLANNSDAKH